MLVLKLGIVYDFDFGSRKEWKYMLLFGLSRAFWTVCILP